MDRHILEKNGVTPSNPVKGYLEHYTLKIGDRASLIPQKNARAYGIVMTVDRAANDKLYAEPSVADYLPEEVIITTENGESVAAICYNLPAASLSGTNPGYALALYKLAEQNGFPDDYLRKIRLMSEG